MTVRNIRAHQSRGLLPPPEVRGRTGYYGPDHVARLQLIQELQAEGMPLELIKRLLERSGGSSDELLSFKKALQSPWAGEETRTVGIAELIEQSGTADPTLLLRALELGLVRRLDNGLFEIRSPRLVAAGRELLQFGVGLERSLEFLASVRAQADGIADTCVELFLETVWTPFEQGGRPRERWPEVREALERLSPLAAESLLAIFGMAMRDAVERESGRVVRQMAGSAD